LLWNSLSLAMTVRDVSLTLTQFCTRQKTFMFSRAYGTSSQRLCDSFGCKVCLHEHKFTYLLTFASSAVPLCCITFTFTLTLTAELMLYALLVSTR